VALLRTASRTRVPLEIPPIGRRISRRPQTRARSGAKRLCANPVRRRVRRLVPLRTKTLPRLLTIRNRPFVLCVKQ